MVAGKNQKKTCSAGPNLGRHESGCRICAHPQRQDIERDFIGWKSPAKIAHEYDLRDRSTVYRHAHALDLFPKRARNVRAALEKIIEKSEDVAVNAAAVVQAVAAYARINSQGQLLERNQQINLTDLFGRMTPRNSTCMPKMARSRSGSLEQWAQHGSTVQGGAEMAKSMKTNHHRNSLPATLSGLRPGDFTLGSVESRAVARALVLNQTTEQLESEAIELGNLTAFELAVTGHTGLERLWLIRLARMAEERAETFGFSLPTPQQIRHAREVSRVADGLAGGSLLELSCANPAEAKRLRDLAEERLLNEARATRT